MDTRERFVTYWAIYRSALRTGRQLPPTALQSMFRLLEQLRIETQNRVSQSGRVTAEHRTPAREQ